MVEMSEQDFVSWPEFASNGAADRKRQRSHVRTEDDLVRITAEKVGHCRTGAGNHLVGVAAGVVRPAGVRVVGAEVAGNCINHFLRDLRSAGAVEKYGGTAVDFLLKRRELGAHPIQIEWFRNRC